MVYENVSRIAKEKGYSLRYIEQNADISLGCISKWKNSIPTADKLTRVAKVLEVSVEELLEGVV